MSQLASYLNDDLVVATRIGEALPSFLVLLLVFLTSYNSDAEHSSVVEFHMCVAVLVAVGGMVYFLLPLTNSVQLIFKMESLDMSQYAGVESDPAFLWSCQQMPLEIFGLSISKILYYSAMTVTPYYESSDEPGDLAQALVLTAMFGDVVGRLIALNAALTDLFKQKIWLSRLIVVDVIVSAGAFVLVVVLHVRFVRCMAYFVMIALNAFLYCVTNIAGLSRVETQFHRPKFVCVLNVMAGLMCVVSKLGILVGVSVSQ